MGKNKTPDPPNCQKYGVPVYGAAWVPLKVVSDQKQNEEDEVSVNESQKLIAAQNYMVFAGGGGEGRSGIPNALLLAHFDFGSNFLSDQPDGHLRVFKWPCMGVVIDEARAHSAVKDLDFSPDGKFLVSLGSGGPCRVWDVTSSAVVASLAKENDEVFGFCRFSQVGDNKQVLYTTVMRAQGGSIVTWDTTSWRRLSSKQIIRDAISAFNVSADGKLLAIGTVQGDILIVNSTSMRVQTMVRKAHLGLVTVLAFSQDSRALVSASLDSSARVTLTKVEKTNGFNWWVIIFIILIAIAAYVLKAKGILKGILF